MKRPIKKSRISRAGRLAAVALVAVIAVAGIASSIGANGGNAYLVRANFVNSSGITTGANVRVGGANVGSIQKIFVNSLNQSSVVLAITDPAFQRFYSNATCRIRLQSLVGEKFVDCDPGSPSKPELRADPTMPERRLMTVAQTRSPVDSDQLLDAMREPERERFRVVLNELGVTLTGRGQDLQEIIQNFDGTFKEVDAVLKILAKQNRELNLMAVKGDQALQDLAANRKHVTGLFREADRTNRAVNAKRAQLDATLARLPAFLDQLEPTAREIKTLSVEAAPVAHAARLSAKNLSTFASNTSAFANAANPALKKFGDTLDVFRAQIPVLQPIATDLNTFVGNRASVTNIKKLLESFDKQGGYMNLASMAYGIANAANGFDSFGHFIRAGLVVSAACLYYAQRSQRNCGANYADNRSGTPDYPPASTTKKPASTTAPTSATGASAGSSRSSSDAAALDYLLGGEHK